MNSAFVRAAGGEALDDHVTLRDKHVDVAVPIRKPGAHQRTDCPHPFPVAGLAQRRVMVNEGLGEVFVDRVNVALA